MVLNRDRQSNRLNGKLVLRTLMTNEIGPFICSLSIKSKLRYKYGFRYVCTIIYKTKFSRKKSSYEHK